MPLLTYTTDAEWHAIRASHVGASQVSALFGCSPFHSAFEFWQVKAGRINARPVDGPRPRWGRLLEAAIGAAVAEDQGWAVEPFGGYVTHDTVRGMGCTPDFHATTAGYLEGGKQILVECKNTDWLVHRRQWTDAEPPMHIVLQLQHQLACTGLASGVVACLVGGNDLRLYPYERHDTVIAEIERRVAEFWASIDAGVCPYAPDGSDASTYALNALYTETDPEPADLSADNELPLLCEAYKSASALRLEYEKAAQAARNAILAKVGAAAAARCNGYWIKAPVSPVSEKRIAATTMRRLTIKEMNT